MTITFKNGSSIVLADVDENRLATILTTYINMRPMVVEPTESVQISSPPKPTLDDVKAWARENRQWVAWDGDQECYEYSARPVADKQGVWILVNDCDELHHRHEWDNRDPGVPWDQSLIAPDGRMLSVDPPKPKRKKRTEWRVGDSVRMNNGVRGTLIRLDHGQWYVESWNTGYRTWQAIGLLDPTFPRNARRSKPKAPKLKRGMLCAMWDDTNSEGEIKAILAKEATK